MIPWKVVCHRLRIQKGSQTTPNVVWISLHTKIHTDRNIQKQNVLNSIKPNSVLIIVGAGRLGPARRGSCDLCFRLTIKWSNNSCWMAGELVYLDAKVLSVTFSLINEHLLSIFGYTASPACLVWIVDFWPPPRKAVTVRITQPTPSTISSSPPQRPPACIGEQEEEVESRGRASTPLRRLFGFSSGMAEAGSARFVLRCDWLRSPHVVASIHEGPGVFLPPLELEFIPKLTSWTGVCVCLTKLGLLSCENTQHILKSYKHVAFKVFLKTTSIL